MHNEMYMIYIVEENHSFTHSCSQHVHDNFIIIHKKIQLQDLNTQEYLSLKEARPATSYVAAMFHPTIGQCAHQSLSSTATPELSMIPTRNKGTLVDSHIAKDTTKTQPIQHSWVYRLSSQGLHTRPSAQQDTTNPRSWVKRLPYKPISLGLIGC